MNSLEKCLQLFLICLFCDKIILEPTAVLSYCPNDYPIEIGDRCFKFVKRPFRGWDSARSECEENPGRDPDLAVIRSAREMAVFVAEIKDFEMGGYWIGLYHDDWNDVWKWVDGSPYRFNYFDGTPDSEDFAYMRTHPPPTGRWGSGRPPKNTGALCQVYKDRRNPIITPPAPTPSHCRYSYTRWLYGCYKLFNMKKTWGAAETFCKTEGGHLASVHSDSENAAIFLLGKNLTQNFWIGFRKNENGEFTWADGWPNDIYTNWDRSINPSQKCVSMHTKGKDITMWKKTSCNIKLPFVCKISNEVIPTAPSRTKGECPTPTSTSSYYKWKKYKSNCYCTTQALESYAAGQKECQKLSSEGFSVSLASIHTYGEDNFIYNNFKYSDTMWIGLVKKDARTPFKWIDNSTFQYEAWAPGQKITPDSSGEVYIDFKDYQGQWVLTSAKQSRRPLCKTLTAPPIDSLTTFTPPSPTPPNVPGKCRTDANWVGYGKWCFLFFPDASTMRTQAALRCEYLNATLATVQDKAHSVWLAEMGEKLRVFPKSRPFWIGLHKTGFVRNWIWEDGTSLDRARSNWDRKYPNDLNCVLLTSEGKWQNQKCSVRIRGPNPGFICQSNKNIEHSTSMAIGILPATKLRTIFIWIITINILNI